MENVLFSPNVVMKLEFVRSKLGDDFMHKVDTVSNPCVSGDTLVDTPYGKIEARKLSIGDIIIVKDKTGKFYNKPITNIEINENIQLYKVKFGNGVELEVTAAHQFYTFDDKGRRYPIKLEHIINIFLNSKKYLPIETTTTPTGIVCVSKTKKDTVYDIYEETTDTWITDGIINRGCGEVPLLPNMACNLGSINLSKLVRKND